MPPARSTERLVAAALALLTLLDIALGFVRPPQSPNGLGALVRFGLCVPSVVTLQLGPGFVIAALRRRSPGEWLGFFVLPGIGLSAATGLVAWLLAGWIRPEVTCAVVAAPVSAAVLGAAWRTPGALDRFDGRAVAVVGLLFLLAAGRGLYSVDPHGDIYRGMVSQTNDASRPDSRIQMHVVQLVANGVVPWTTLGEQNFRPYDFSSRGPLAGLAAAPVVLIAGAHPDMTPDFQPWSPFDAQGFMAYRLAMIGLAAFALLLLYGLARRLLGPPEALFALLLAALTPFIVHETFFTWPKLLAGCLLLAGAHVLLAGWGLRAGLLSGASYLAHPLGLLAVPTLLLLLLTRVPGVSGVTWARRAVRAAGVAAGALACWEGWRLVNVSGYTQEGFLTYLTGPPGLRQWVAFRIDSMVSTLVPLWSAFTHVGDIFYDSVSGPHHSWAVLLGINYSCALPMAVGITFSPLFLVAMWSAFRRRPWLFTAVAVIPLLLFWIYWGANSTGLIREGLHPWFLTLILLYAYGRRSLVRRWPWWRPLERVLLITRAVEALFVVVGPSIATNATLIVRRSDIAGLAMILAAFAVLAWWTWRHLAGMSPETGGTATAPA